MWTELLAALAFRPIATISSMVTYGLLLLLAVPSLRERANAILVHPVSSKQTYLSSFDTFRGGAACLVALGHCSYFTAPMMSERMPFLLAVLLGQAAKAIPVFVALSGFLIYRSLRGTTSSSEIRTYFWRRFLRIYPLYLFSVVLCLLTGQMLGVHPGIADSAFLVSEVLMLRSIGFAVFANPVTWSLYVEILFYCALPAYVLLVPRSRVLFTAAVAFFAFTIAEQTGPRELLLWKYFPIGIIAAEIAERCRPVLGSKASSGLFLAGLVILAADFAGSRADWFNLLIGRPGGTFTVGLALACALLLLGLSQPNSFTRMLSIAPLRIMGVISYSIFLIHPFYIWSTFPELEFWLIGKKFDTFAGQPLMPGYYLWLVYFPGIISWSLATYMLIERPFLLKLRRPSPRRSRHRRAGSLPRWIRANQSTLRQ